MLGDVLDELVALGTARAHSPFEEALLVQRRQRVAGRLAVGWATQGGWLNFSLTQESLAARGSSHNLPERHGPQLPGHGQRWTGPQH